MGPSLTALCLFAGWTILLVVSLAGYRVLTTQRTGKALNTFAPGATSGQGVGGQWYVVDGAGNAITKAPAATSSGY